MGGFMALSLLAGGFQAYNQYQSSKAEAQSLLQQVELNKIRANEIEERSIINIDRTQRASNTFQETQKASLAGSGFEVGGVATLQMLEDTVAKTIEEIDNIERETAYELETIRLENESLRSSAREVKRAGKLGAIGTLLGAGVSAYRSSPKGYSKSRRYAPPKDGMGPRLPRGR
jgi:hypothetical protein